MSYDVKLSGDKLIITLDVSRKAVEGAKLSKSEKTRLVASTGGFRDVDGKPGLMLAFNLITR